MADGEYERILLKLSGEALLGQEDYGIDPAIIHRIAVDGIQGDDRLPALPSLAGYDAHILGRHQK